MVNLPAGVDGNSTIIEVVGISDGGIDEAKSLLNTIEVTEDDNENNSYVIYL